jgi:hypothetical protein
MCHRIKFDKVDVHKVLEEAGYIGSLKDQVYFELEAFSDAKWQREVSEHTHLVIDKMLEKKNVGGMGNRRSREDNRKEPKFV